MTNKFYNSYKAVFDKIKTDLQAVSSIKNVVLGEEFRVTDVPMAVINPEHTEVKQSAFGNLLENKINFSVIIIIRETEPANWFTDVLAPMGDVMDAVLADRSLGGTVKDTTPTLFSPGEIRTRGKLWYGGVLRFQCLLHFTP